MPSAAEKGGKSVPWVNCGMPLALQVDALLSKVRERFDTIPDSRFGDSTISLPDALMSGFALFALKEPSLLAFQERIQEPNPKWFHPPPPPIRPGAGQMPLRGWRRVFRIALAIGASYPGQPEARMKRGDEGFAPG